MLLGMNMLKVKNGFTLSEVLIAVLIIGVIAAMTIPALINSTNDSEYKAQLKKTFSNIASATESIKEDNGGTMVGFASVNTMMAAYAEKFSTTQVCPAGGSKCWYTAPSYFYDGSQVPTNWTWVNYSSLVLADGAVMFMEFTSPTCTYAGYGTPECANFTIDINGSKKPNKLGKDIFLVHITKYGIVPWGVKADGFGCTGTGFGCAAKVILE